MTRRRGRKSNIWTFLEVLKFWLLTASNFCPFCSLQTLTKNFSSSEWWTTSRIALKFLLNMRATIHDGHNKQFYHLNLRIQLIDGRMSEIAMKLSHVDIKCKFFWFESRSDSWKQKMSKEKEEMKWWGLKRQEVAKHLFSISFQVLKTRSLKILCLWHVFISIQLLLNFFLSIQPRKNFIHLNFYWKLFYGSEFHKFSISSSISQHAMQIFDRKKSLKLLISP